MEAFESNANLRSLNDSSSSSKLRIVLFRERENSVRGEKKKKEKL